MSGNPKHSRFKDAPWYLESLDINRNVIIGGAGGIGSWLALLLTRAGFMCHVYDFDLLEEHNMGGQWYSQENIGQSKVESLRDSIQQYSGSRMIPYNKMMDENTMTNKFIFSAFDNMLARKNMFKKWADTYVAKSSPDYDSDAIFIDGRLTAEQLWIFCVRAKDKDNVNEYWKNHIFPDSEIEDAPCTMKQTSHAAAMIASFMTAFFTNHVTNIVEKDELRNVPFMFEYFIPLNLLTL